MDRLSGRKPGIKEALISKLFCLFRLLSLIWQQCSSCSSFYLLFKKLAFTTLFLLLFIFQFMFTWQPWIFFGDLKFVFICNFYSYSLINVEFGLVFLRFADYKWSGVKIKKLSNKKSFAIIANYHKSAQTILG